MIKLERSLDTPADISGHRHEAVQLPTAGASTSEGRFDIRSKIGSPCRLTARLRTLIESCSHRTPLHVALTNHYHLVAQGAMLGERSLQAWAYQGRHRTVCLLAHRRRNEGEFSTLAPGCVPRHIRRVLRLLRELHPMENHKRQPQGKALK